MILLQRQATTPSRIHESCGQGFLGLARILGSLPQYFKAGFGAQLHPKQGSEPSSTHPSRPDTFFQNKSEAGFWAHAGPSRLLTWRLRKQGYEPSSTHLGRPDACSQTKHGSEPISTGPPCLSIYKLQPGTFNRSRVLSPARPIIDRHSVSRLNPARRMLERRIS